MTPEQVEAEYQALDPDQNLHLSWLAVISALSEGTPEDAEKQLRIIAVAGRQLNEPLEQLTAMRWMAQCEKWRNRPEVAAKYEKKIETLRKITKLKVPKRIDEDQLALAWAAEDPANPVVIEAIKKSSQKEISEIFGRIAAAYEKHGDKDRANRLRSDSARIKRAGSAFKASTNRAPTPEIGDSSKTD